MKAPILFSCLLISLTTAHANETPLSKADDEKGLRFFDDDGYLDIGEFLDRPFGFYPVVVPITEPAVGYGAAVVPVFMNRPEGREKTDFYALGGLATENGTEGLFAFYSGYHLDERLQIEAALIGASINLDFYGLGSSIIPSNNPLRYNVDLTGIEFGGEWKLKEDANWNVGLKYFYGDANASIRSFPGSEFLPPEIDLSALGARTIFSSFKTTINYDTRNNIFTPTKGQITELGVVWNQKAFGADDDFQILQFQTLQFHPLIEDKLYLSARGDFKQSFGNIPFYRQPYLELRGAPIARYQGDGIIQAEAELRWQVHQRWSLLGFAGVGNYWIDDSVFEGNKTIATGGLGFRYLISKRHGMHTGVDVGFSENDTAVYIQFGHAWPRT
ncbi:BamA/TamA family outer membrane protein [Rubritalea tangerina]|uniref:BamA/TamA family outer membrane protein n=1 Tax=Rubritalea tangerina TaxID=430798 RepID=A0ABW4ZDN9_9BACT